MQKKPSGQAEPAAGTATGFPQHLLAIAGLSREAIVSILERANDYIDAPKLPRYRQILEGRSVMTLFYENSTRTRTSFEVAGKRLGADVINMAVDHSSVKKGETLIDTALTLNAMRPDILVVRHQDSGAVHLLASKMDCCVINAGDGRHEHPTQALLDVITIERHRGKLAGLVIAICGDLAHSRVARSNIYLMQLMGAEVRLIAPPTLMPAAIDRLGVQVFYSMAEGLKGCDIVMMLRLQSERMASGLVPSLREYYHFYGLDSEKLKYAKTDALVMHPGPMNRGVEIDSLVADNKSRSLISPQVEAGVAVRMAIMELLLNAQDKRNPSETEPGQSASERLLQENASSFANNFDSHSTKEGKRK